MMIYIKAEQGLDYPIELAQKSKRKFVVTYGAEVNVFPNLTLAMDCFNSCVLHSAECLGAN